MHYNKRMERRGHPLKAGFRRAFPLALAVLLLCPSCGGGGSREIAFRELERGHSYGYGPGEGDSGPSIEVACDLEGWRELWGRLHPPSTGEEAAGPPELDPASTVAVAVFQGVKPTGGYAIVVSSVKVRGNSVEVRAELTAPRPGSMVTQALTAPYCLVALSRSEMGLSGEAEFVLLDSGGSRLADTMVSL